MLKILVVGAGPVGLWTAIQTKLMSPKAEIVINEKYEEYKRSHPLRLELSALKSLQIPNNSEYKAQIESMQNAILALGSPHWDAFSGKYINIRTNDLEANLKSVAQNIGIRIEKKEFEGIEDIPAEIQYVIGADGARSKVRKIVCNDEEDNTERKTMKYVVEMKYESYGVNVNHSVIQKYPTQKLLNFFTDDYVGKWNNDTGRYPVSIRFFVDKDTYDALGDANFKNSKRAIDICKEQFPEKLKQDIRVWLNARKDSGASITDVQSIKITKLPLEAYCSKSFAKIQDNKFICIAGDAAGAVPYFRALNGGLERGAKLGQMIAQGQSMEQLESNYNSKMSYWLKIEIIKAILKDLLINIWTFFISISSYVPWQVNKWSQKDKERLKNEDPFQAYVLNANNHSHPLLSV